MKKKIKLYLSLGSIIASVLPIAVVLSCGSQNNSQKNKDQDIDLNPSLFDSTAISTNSFFQEINNTIAFYGQSLDYPGIIKIGNNVTMNKGLANVTINYGWSSNAQDTKPSLVVDDYHLLNHMAEGDIFWITLVPNSGFHIIDESVLQITVKSSGIPNVEVYTDDFLNNVKNSVGFFLVLLLPDML